VVLDGWGETVERRAHALFRAHLERLWPGRTCEPGGDPFRGERGWSLTLRPGDRVQVFGELRRAEDAAATRELRRAAATVLVPVGVATLRIVAK
jgi:hypothetical protein